METEKVPEEGGQLYQFLLPFPFLWAVEDGPLREMTAGSQGYWPPAILWQRISLE